MDRVQINCKTCGKTGLHKIDVDVLQVYKTIIRDSEEPAGAKLRLVVRCRFCDALLMDVTGEIGQMVMFPDG